MQPMKYLKLKVLAVLLVAICATSKISAKEVVVPKMYMFAFAASFTDTIVHFTNVMEVDSVWIQSKNKFLIGRDAYSRQFREYLSEKKQMPNRTCVVFYDLNRKKAEKKYLNLLFNIERMPEEEELWMMKREQMQELLQLRELMLSARADLDKAMQEWETHLTEVQGEVKKNKIKQYNPNFPGKDGERTSPGQLLPGEVNRKKRN